MTVTSWQVIQGDCLAVMPRMSGVDHIITDPPFEAEAHTKQRRVKRAEVCELEPLSFSPITAEERHLAGGLFASLANRWCLVFCQAEAAHKWIDAIPLRAMRYCVWIKPDGQPQYTGDRPGMGYETIVALHSDAKSRWNGGGRNGVFVHNKYDASGQDLSGRNAHPTTKPLSLMLELIELFTDPDDLILDPFCGSGTTGVAAIRLGRRFLGIEKDEGYAQLAHERLTAETHHSTLRHLRTGQEALFK